MQPESLEEFDKHIGLLLRLLRKRRGLTQMELAEKLDISYQQLQKYETGKNRISASRLAVIAGALNVPVTVFFKPENGRSAEEATISVDILSDNPSLTRLVRLFHRIESEQLQGLLLQCAMVFAKESPMVR